MSDSCFVLFLGKYPEIRIIDFFLDSPFNSFTTKEIIEGVGMSYTTFYKIWKKFLDFGIVKITKRIGKIKLYQLDKDSPVVVKILEMERLLIDNYVDNQLSLKKVKVPISQP